MKSKTICYLSMICLGLALYQLWPWSQFLPANPFVLVCAMFIPYFGWRKILAIYYAPYVFACIRSWPYLADLGIAIASIMNKITRESYENSGLTDPSYIDPLILLFALIPAIFFSITISLVITHYALNKAGVFERIIF